jgi:hypothetical protein
MVAAVEIQALLISTCTSLHKIHLPGWLISIFAHIKHVE